MSNDGCSRGLDEIVVFLSLAAFPGPKEGREGPSQEPEQQSQQPFQPACQQAAVHA